MVAYRPRDNQAAPAQNARADIEAVVGATDVAGAFIKMHTGTWHAGPLFTSPSHIDFYNLELSDTNVTDHHNVFFDALDLELGS